MFCLPLTVLPVAYPRCIILGKHTWALVRNLQWVKPRTRFASHHKQRGRSRHVCGDTENDTFFTSRRKPRLYILLISTTSIIMFQFVK